MGKIPRNLENDALSDYLKKQGLKRISQGKVRDTWYLDDERLLVVTTDRISIFDFVLNATVPQKGEVLTALTHFWLTDILHGFDHHLIRSEKFPTFNAARDLREDLNRLPIERCLVVKNLTGKIYPFEMIYRHHIGGSVFKKYQATGMAGGHQLPKGLPKWAKLEKPIFTPSTKEEIGHDINVDADYFFKEMKNNGFGDEPYGVVEMLSIAYATAYAYAENLGVLILDTKFETAGLTIVDEILTPDSSRFALKDDLEKAFREGRDPYFHDKQPVRDWGAKVKTPFLDENNQEIIGINKLEPKNQEHIDFVHSLTIPSEVISGTTNRYLEIFKMITGESLSSYQLRKLGI